VTRELAVAQVASQQLCLRLKRHHLGCPGGVAQAVKGEKGGQWKQWGSYLFWQERRGRGVGSYDDNRTLQELYNRQICHTWNPGRGRCRGHQLLAPAWVGRLAGCDFLPNDPTRLAPATTTPCRAPLEVPSVATAAAASLFPSTVCRPARRRALRCRVHTPNRLVGLPPLTAPPSVCATTLISTWMFFHTEHRPVGSQQEAQWPKQPRTDT
jgi:hypothetical protein